VLKKIGSIIRRHRLKDLSKRLHAQYFKYSQLPNHGQMGKYQPLELHFKLGEYFSDMLILRFSHQIGYICDRQLLQSVNVLQKTAHFGAA
jgi:hypothetical protein